jgi:hypothetical protein
VDETIEELAKEAAGREGEDVSSWLRRLVVRELRPSPLIEAWMDRVKASHDEGVASDHKAEFYLAPLPPSLNGPRDFIIYETPTLRLSASSHRTRCEYWSQLERHWIFLRSSPTPWTSVGQMQYLDGRIVLTLRRVL